MNVPAECIRPLDDAETAGDGYDEDGFDSEGSDTSSTANATEQQEKDVLTQKQEERAEGAVVPRENVVSSGAPQRQNVQSVVEDAVAVAKRTQEEDQKPPILMQEIEMLSDGFGNAGVPNMQVLPDGFPVVLYPLVHSPMPSDVEWGLSLSLSLSLYPYPYIPIPIPIPISLPLSRYKIIPIVFSNHIVCVQRRSYYKLVVRVLQGRNLPPKLVTKHCACVVHCAVLKEAQCTGPSSNGQGSVTAEVVFHHASLSLSLSLLCLSRSLILSSCLAGSVARSFLMVAPWLTPS
jgi:hypothetical protein